MATVRGHLALAVAGICCVASIAGIAVSSGGARAAGVTDAYLNSTVLATLNEETADGWNPTTSSLYINWSATDPTQVNFTDHSLTRFDPETDLRDLETMEEYEAENPGDTSQQAGIARMYPVVAAQFKNTYDSSGWVYWDLLDLATLTGDSQWPVDAEAMAHHFSGYISPTTGLKEGEVTPDTSEGDTAPVCTANGYRVDSELESALMLIDAGTRFATSTWTTEGYTAYNLVRQQAFNPTYGLYDRIMCNGAVWDPNAKVEEIADEARDGILAGEYVNNPSLVADGISLLDTLVANKTGLHDTVNGGWCPSFNLSTGALDCHVKTDRQYLLLRAFDQADQLYPGRYSAEETELVDLIPSVVTSPHVGFVYERTPTYGIYEGQDWITTEADGIVSQALQMYIANNPDGTMGSSGSGGTTSTSSSSSSAGSTSTSSSTTTTTSTTTASTTTTSTTTSSSSSSSSTTTKTSSSSSSSSTTTSSSTTSTAPPPPAPAPPAGCPWQQTTSTQTVKSGSSVSLVLTAAYPTLCATMAWTGSAQLDLLVTNSSGGTVLAEATTGKSPETVKASTVPGTVYKVTITSVSGSVTASLGTTP